MKEEILLIIIASILCLGVAAIIFKALLNLIPKEFKYAKVSKIIYCIVYWGLFIGMINIPIISYEIYELVPFEDGQYIQLTMETDGSGSAVFQYQENGTTKPRYVHFLPYNRGYFFDFEEKISEIIVEESDNVYRIAEDGLHSGANKILTRVEKWSLFKAITASSTETWIANISKDEVQSIADSMWPTK